MIEDVRLADPTRAVAGATLTAPPGAEPRATADLSRQPLLIVNADDFGFTPATSRAIVEGHRFGIVTSTSVIAVGAAFFETVPWLAEVPRLGTGAHLAVSGGLQPVSPPEQIPSLVDATGRLWPTWREFLTRAATGRIDPEDLVREFDAQLTRLRASGLHITHLDTHQNLHLWPMVASAVMRVGEEHGIRAIRVPRSNAPSVTGSAVRRLAGRLERSVRRAGWVFPGGYAGFDEVGAFDRASIEFAVFRLARQGAGIAELATHPGEPADDELPRFEWLDRPSELLALTSERLRRAVERFGFVLGHYGDVGGSSERVR